MEIIYLATLTVIAFTIASIAGFGSNIIALSLGLGFYPLSFLMPVLLPLNVLINFLIVIKHRHNISREIIKLIFPLFPAGSALGMVLFHLFVMSKGIIILFAIFILFVSLKDFYRQYREDHIVTRSKNYLDIKLLSTIYTFSSGIIHGIFATGGPLLVIAAGRLNPGKVALRSTLPVVWVIMNFILISTYAASGLFNIDTLKFTVLLIPFALFGFFIGEKTFLRIDEERFKTIVNLILIASAIVILLKYIT